MERGALDQQAALDAAAMPPPPPPRRRYTAQELRRVDLSEVMEELHEKDVGDILAHRLPKSGGVSSSVVTTDAMTVTHNGEQGTTTVTRQKTVSSTVTHHSCAPPECMFLKTEKHVVPSTTSRGAAISTRLGSRPRFCSENACDYRQGLNELVAPFVAPALSGAPEERYACFAAFVLRFAGKPMVGAAGCEDQTAPIESALFSLWRLISFHDPQLLFTLHDGACSAEIVEEGSVCSWPPSRRAAAFTWHCSEGRSAFAARRSAIRAVGDRRPDRAVSSRRPPTDDRRCGMLGCCSGAALASPLAGRALGRSST